VFIPTYIGLLAVHFVIISVFFNLYPIEILFHFLFSPFLIVNLVASFFLFLAWFLLLSFLEFKKVKNVYFNARNRTDFLKDNEIACIEGEIKVKEGYTPLISPISQQDSIFYAYGSNKVGGGMVQIKSVIKPSGEVIPLNGWLNGDYVEKREYDPTQSDLSHLFSFMMERKDSKVRESEVLKAPYFYERLEGSTQNDSFSNHKILNTLDEEMFKSNKYLEVVIPSGIYGWALGRWDAENRQLLPLPFSNIIFITQKDYRNTFLEYAQKKKKKILTQVIALIILSGIMSIPIYFPFFTW